MIDQPVDKRRRTLLTGAVGAVGGLGVLGAAVPFVAAWTPSERAQAIGAPIEIDYSKLGEGEMMVSEWRGKPIFVMRRSQAQLDAITAMESAVRDPNSQEEQQPEYAANEFRSRKPELLVLVGSCTHLGCSPKHYGPTVAGMGANWQGGFFCPCHGSKFDLAGRVFRGVPAPTNLVVPPYEFVEDTIVRVGADGQEAA